MKLNTLLATVCAAALAGPAAAQGISLDELLNLDRLSDRGGNSGTEGLRLDGLAEVTLGDTTILSSPTETPLITANVLDDRAGSDADILNVVLGDGYSGDNNDTIGLDQLDRLLGRDDDGDRDSDGLALDGLAEVRLLNETLISSDDEPPLVAANVLDTDSDDGLTVADVVIGIDRDNDGDDVGSDLARALGDVVGAVSEDSRDRSRGLLRLDGVAEVSLGNATIISSGDREPAVRANVLDVSEDRTNVASVNVNTNGGDRDTAEADASASASTSRDRGLLGSVSRITDGLLR